MKTFLVVVLVLGAAATLWFIRRKKLGDIGSAGPSAQPSKRSPEN